MKRFVILFKNCTAKLFSNVKENGFTLAEMLVVMLILTIVLAAFAPLMTKRRSFQENTSPWKYSDNNSDIYYGLAATHTAMIGQKSKDSSDIKSRLIINTSSNSQSHIGFTSSDSTLGRLQMYGSSIVLGGSIESDTDNSGTENTGLGYKAFGDGVKGIGNTAIGTSTLFSNASNYNTAVGVSALSSSVSSEYNTALGAYALAKSVSSGGYNVAVGMRALYETSNAGANNVAIGTDSMSYAEGASHNIAIGYQAMNVVKGQRNIGFGHTVARYLTTGNDNLALGYYALLSNSGGSNNVALGKEACRYVRGSNKTCIGAMSGPADYESAAGSATREIYLGSSSNPANTLVYNNLTVYGTYSNPSDRRLKNVKGEYKGGLEKLRELKIYNFTFKKDKEKTPRVGVISQEVQKIFPNAVTKDADGYLMLRKEDIFFTMVNAIKELDKITQSLIGEVKTALIKLDSHDEEIKKLQQENQELKARIERLEKLVK